MPSFKKFIKMYHDLIKSFQTLLLLYTAIFSYLISTRPSQSVGTFNWADFLWFILSIFLSVSGTTLINMAIDADIDAIMERTKCRPIPSGEISKQTVLWNGIIMTAIGIGIAILTLDLLTAFIIFLGFVFDGIVYSVLLKRRTKYSILFGGISGGLPALAGRVLAVGKVDLVGIFFLLFILTWIPVHILTLALLPKNLKGYRDAGVPMWPVVESKESTMRVIAGSAFLNMIVLYLIACTLHIDRLVRYVIALACASLIFLVIKNLLKPSEKLTWLIFKVASMFMVLGFLLMHIGVMVI